MSQCQWCERPFQARKIGAHDKVFCCSRCKDAYHTALRRWGQQALAAGRLSVDDLKAPAASCTTAVDVKYPQSRGRAPTE